MKCVLRHAADDTLYARNLCKKNRYRTNFTVLKNAQRNYQNTVAIDLNHRFSIERWRSILMLIHYRFSVLIASMQMILILYLQYRPTTTPELSIRDSGTYTPSMVVVRRQERVVADLRIFLK